VNKNRKGKKMFKIKKYMMKEDENEIIKKIKNLDFKNVKYV
jgi:hypothetical protein